ncbi:phosphate uptake regulator, PhoU [Tindallia magadiensis]|uniref:Phosphate-specific transport system accessory protein PhoU n=1 Tax=Tindallia magadiensis TaxID=69895 RepID=A0A1I3B852_9FIRM|nr:phosphate signaling complex protein PhoU [Tindallia magadiensis]SFH58246.1 phosphate uptake regulator, PhoU [Tindallia magadiensis]
MRTSYVERLKGLKVKVLKMGSMVQEIIEESLQALMEQDMEKAEKIYEMDDCIDKMELEIENECMELIALQQPMAKDLRIIGTILKAITDLERMGDHAVNIAKQTKLIGKEPFIKPLIDIPRMAYLSEKMVAKCLDSFLKEDLTLAKEVSYDDDDVDEIYERVYLELLEMMIEDQKIIKQAFHLLLIARFLERIADHATNISERVIYMVTAERIEIN